MAKNKLSKIRRADPHFARESENYDQPLPSREYILQTLTAEGRPLLFAEIAELLDVMPHELDMFRRRLAAMEREAELMQNRKGAYILPEKAALIAGRVQGHADGFGFLVPDAGGADIFLAAKQMDKVLHGDRALVRVVGLDRRGRPEGAIVEVIERGKTRVVGRVLIEHGVTCVVAEDRRISQDILIPPETDKKGRVKEAKCRSGQVVIAEITEPPTRHTQPIGRIVEVLGNYADPGMEIEIALRKHDMPFEFSREAEEDAAGIPDKVRKADLAGREDLRDLPLVTIDGETAKDFDDAVYCERKGRGWRLIVAIADVSHYVRPGMALDAEATERGNSVYFPRRVIPMLPEKLSNGICSLNPGVDRLAMVCDMDIASTGAIKAYRFYPAVFRSHARLTYNLVWNWLSGEEPPEAIKVGAIASLWNRVTGKGNAAADADAVRRQLQPHVDNLYGLFKALLKARQIRGAIDFETTETMMLFDDQGKIANIVPVVRNDAHRLIEECMLAANVCASEFLQKHQQRCLYRIHEGPTEEKLERLRDFLREFGLDLGGGDEPKAKDYAALLERIKDRPDAQLLQTVMLRSLRQAMYSPDNVGHFGLAYEAYTHFTSPIRRYPDLLVHRAIKAALAGQRYQPGERSWEDIGLHCSATERRADEATRDVENWLKCYYMQDRIGEEFEGTVAAVVSFGIFVALDAVYVEGLVHVSELGEDYFEFDAAKHQMLGQRSGKRFRLGDRLRVKLVRVDLDSGKIDFTLVEAPRRPTAGSAGATRGSGRAPAVEPMFIETEEGRRAGAAAAAKSPPGKPRRDAAPAAKSTSRQRR